MIQRQRIATSTLRERGSHVHCAPAVALVAIAAIAAGCTTRPLLERAIAARGGALQGVVLNAEAQVYAGVPGRWLYRRTYLAPDRYAWRIETTGEADTYVFDGSVVRSFVGDAEVAVDASPTAALRSHARWTGVVLLEGLDTPGVSVAELPPADLPAGAREGLRVRFADGATYRLGFDDHTLLMWADGPLDLSPLINGPTSARYDDPRPAGGILLPRRTTYFAGDQRLAVESIDAACVDPPALTPAAFADPASLPDCPADGR
jgi:hypothetical protein